LTVSLAGRWEAAWTGRGGGFAACCTPDVHYEDPVAVEPLSGLDALSAHAERVRAAFQDLRIERVGDPIETDAFACLPWRALGTHTGELGVLPATDRFVILHGVHYVELSDGLVRRARGFFDLYSGAVQLGLLPQRGSLGETALLLLRGFGLRPRR
jgi:SnoaL-like polyketide cyclase